MTQPRLLADYAAVPTKRERNAARKENRAAQGDLFAIGDDHQADDPIAPLTCAVCAGQHATTRCPHGTAPSLPLNLNNPEQVAARRAMFTNLGWSTTP